MIEAGLFFTIGSLRATLRPLAPLNLRTSEEGAPLKEHITTGFAYSDCRWTMPGCVLNAIDAGTWRLYPHKNALRFPLRKASLWQATLLDCETQRR